MKLAVGIPTYQRNDGSTPEYLARALESVKNQTHQDYKVFLIGDCYTDNAEFEKIATSIIPADKIYFENRSSAPERDIYPMGSQQLWCSGGVSAYNHAIDCALLQGYNYMCHLDHDDFWEINHLSLISQVTEATADAALVYSCSRYLGGKILPSGVTLTGEVYQHIPVPTQTVHSSVCINHGLLPLKYRDVFAEQGQPLEADIDMWVRVKKYINENPALKSYLIGALTCYHDQEKK